MVVIKNQSFSPNSLLYSVFRAVLFSTQFLLASLTQHSLHSTLRKPCFRKGETSHHPQKRLSFSRGIVPAIILANKAFHHFKIILLLSQPHFYLLGGSYQNERNTVNHQRKEEFQISSYPCSFLPGSTKKFSEVTF